MKTLREIEEHVTALAQRIGATKADLPTYGESRDFGYPHIEISAGRYHYVVVERGQELDRRSSTQYGDLLYWIFSSVTHEMAFAYELKNRIVDQDGRRIAFPKQIELMNLISPEMGRRLERDIAEILQRAPYDDESVRALNRTKKNNTS